MSDLPDIPAHEHRISRAEMDDNDLTFRLVSDIHPGHDADAYELKARSVKEADLALAFLLRVRKDEDYVFASHDGQKLGLWTESGLEYTIEAEGFEGGPVEISAEELRFAMEKVYGWYVAQNESMGKLQSKMQNVRGLLHDQVQRITVKSAAHAPDSVAGVLYAQQLQFVERLLRESEV